MQSQRFLVVAHKFHTTAEDELVAYLNMQGAEEVLNIRHAFSDAPDRRSAFRLYRRGTLVADRQTRDYRSWPEPLIYAKELWFTVWWTLRFGGSWDRYIAVDGLLTLFGLLLRTLGRVERVTFWSLDFVPSGRFGSRLRNAIYARVNRYAALHADEVWDHTALMVEAKRKHLGLTPRDYRAHFVVPYGIWLDRITPRTFEECDRNVLVFIGHLIEKQGVQRVIAAIPTIVEAIPNFRFRVIGEGAYRAELERLAQHLNVEGHVDFLGRVEDDREVEDLIARSCVAIAPYLRELDTFTQFGADPGKVKNYLGCGVPTLVTDVPWIARDVEAHGAGEVIDDTTAAIAAAVVHWMQDAERNQQAREHAREFARTFDNATIFDALPL
ncbi:MAG: glycosyltransferase [Chloroflexota bacterium]